ncbi:MgtC/SapB family protein [Paenibacillus peoriae]|uniref:MgtC/SapB family protein n=1 Tax=Paenibacillus peoriae TaxID=59893 RepID=UPI00215AF21C|nr:MgtC/SapB family protein [Paenibacillus peoriae]
MWDWDYLIRVMFAGLCGALIGYERKSRMKEAGIRTHFIVGIGAALMMVVSKYGFQDQAVWSNLSLDPSRIAAQVISGVGFIGAGMIFTQKNRIKGLTTAAGIWTTAGIGIAVGAGMYGLGAGVTLFILAAQSLLHSRFYQMAAPSTRQVVVQVDNEPGVLNRIKELLEHKKLTIHSFHAERINYGEQLVIHMLLKLSRSEGVEELLSLLQEMEGIRSVETKSN